MAPERPTGPTQGVMSADPVASARVRARHRLTGIDSTFVGDRSSVGSPIG